MEMSDEYVAGLQSGIETERQRILKLLEEMVVRDVTCNTCGEHIADAVIDYKELRSKLKENE